MANSDFTGDKNSGQCSRPGCLNLVKGQGRYKYCGDACYREVRRRQTKEGFERFYAELPDRNAYDSAYKMLRRKGLLITRREFLQSMASFLAIGAIETWPQALSDRKERAWSTLKNLRASLILGNDALIKDEVSALQKVSEVIGKQDKRFALRLNAHCDGMRRDYGTPNFDLASKQAEKAIMQWAEQCDYLQVAAGILTQANLYRARIASTGNPPSNAELRNIDRLAHQAYTIARGLCWRQDRHLVKLICHQARRMQARAIAVYGQQPEQAKLIIEDLRTVTQELDAEGYDTSRVWVETLEEEVAYFAQLRKFETANQRWGELRKRADKLYPKAPFSQLSLLRLQIELLLAQDYVSEAVEHIGSYLTMWQQHPTFQHQRVLKGWKDRLGNKIPPVPDDPVSKRGVYAVGIVPFYYFEDRFASL